MSFVYKRTIHFSDTDAAGIVFFARYLSICHEAFEEALAAEGIPISDFFSGKGMITPIAHSEADYLRPLFVGDEIEVRLKGELGAEASVFIVNYEITRKGRHIARVQTRHVCVSAKNRERVPVPDALSKWLETFQ